MTVVTTTENPVVILGGARTAMGGLLGSLSTLPAAALGSAAIKGALDKAGVAADQVDEVIMGNCLPAGQGQAPARQASIGAGVPNSADCTTINKMCGSGMKAAMFSHDLLLAGGTKIMVAGGMESMSNAPHLLLKQRSGIKYGHDRVYDHMALDGLEDAYERGTPMGEFAERTVERYNISREAMDAFAIESLRRAKEANEDGSFDDEIVAVEVKKRGGSLSISQDEQPMNARPDKIPGLRPAFRKDGTISAATASSISDGAAALVLARETEASSRGLKPVAKILGHATHARVPEEFTIAPVHAISSLLDALSWKASDVDLWEINEAFAVVTLAAMQEHALPHDKVNIHGGACALGHPIGTSGARIIVTLMNALKKTGGKRGIASLCIGGGEATAIAIEMIG